MTGRLIRSSSTGAHKVFENQAASCAGRSQLYVDLLTAWADDPVAAELVGPDPAWDAPLRLIGGLH